MACSKAEYIGDAVYAQLDMDGDLLLTTGCHKDCSSDWPRDAICFPPHVLEKLLDYISWCAPNGSQNYTIKRIGI